MQPEQEERLGVGTEVHSKSLDDDTADSTEVGPRTAALGFTRAEIDAARRKSERIERRRRRHQAYQEWEADRQQDDIMAGLRTLWRMATREDRPAVERIAERVREGAL